ncbi:MAG: CDP-alcohol phosphatidyltransferase family protein [Acidilobaceae archaeon]|nr:CDP-alcohol phosphatidyltransferase family protein [Acidilobaceae archaeon]MDW7973825.1 CDP-alcohol phosphatidyltransferase family protein [Sulfolobales archaeon]
MGKRIGELGVHPNQLTLLGLGLSLLVPLLAYFGYGIAAVLLMVLSALFDALDGLVARASGKESKFGAVLDSVSDRISDASYVLTVALLGVDILLCYVLLALSFVISYQAALAEGMGLRMKGIGILERKHRVPALVAVAALALWEVMWATAGVILMIALSLVTIAQRMSALARVAG